MKHRLTGIILAVAVVMLLLVSVISPVLADQGQAQQIGPPEHVQFRLPTIAGERARVDPFSIATVKAVNREKGQIVSIEYEVEISSLPATTPDGYVVDTQWYHRKDSAGYSFYESGNNYFTARVVGGRASVEDENGKLAVWNPVVFIGNQIYGGGQPKVVHDPLNDNYQYNCLLWEYGTYSTGNIFTRKTALVERYLRIIEGHVMEFWIFPIDPQNDVTFALREKQELGYLGDITWITAYDARGLPLNIYIEDSGHYTIPASEFEGKTYPVTVDPTSTFTSSASDGMLTKTDASFVNIVTSTTASGVYTTNASTWLGQYFYMSTYGLYRAGLFFDTSSIPDNATISAANLQLYGANGDFNVTKFYIIVQTGMPTYPSDPMVTSDYNRNHYSGNGGSFYTGNFAVGSYNTITLYSAGISWINKTGDTKFMLRSSRDINTDEPTGDEYIIYNSYEKGSGYAPKLTVTYTLPVTLPTVTTYSATDIGETSMTLRGYLGSDGGAPCSVYFQYGPTTAYGLTSNSVTGATSGQTFNIGIVGLSRGTRYYYRAVAVNSAGTSYGPRLDSYTIPGPPTNFTATPGNQQNVLAWAKGDGATNTMVRFSTTSYPTSPTSGTQVYYGTGTGTTHSELTAGQPYYYSAWSYTASYSLTRATAHGVPYYEGAPDVTTNAATGVGITTATLNAWLDALNQDGGSVTVSFEYGETTGYGSTANGVPPTLTAAGGFSADLTSLDTDTTYHFRAKAVGTHGTGYGSDMTFHTGAYSAPTITTSAATGTGMTFTTLNGAVTDDGGLSVTVWFKYGLSETNLDQTSSTVSGLYTDETFYYALTGLEPDTTYYFQAVGENTAGAGYGSILNFTTTSPSEPTVRTNAPATVGANTATLSGTLVSDGGVGCDVQFEWGESTGNYTSYTGWQSDTRSGEIFTAVLSGLTVGETYYYRAAARNAGGTVYGDEESFTTIFEEPDNFSARSVGATTISLTWSKKGDLTYIVYKTTGYPVDRLDGTQVYFGDASSTSHDALEPGVTYFYRAWSWRTGDIWSPNYAEDAATTLPTRTQEEKEYYSPEMPMPDDMFLEPGTDRLVNIPGYEMINSAADELGMPHGLFWMLMSIGVLLALGLIIYIPTGNLLLALVLVGGGMVACTGLGIMPLWMTIVYAILAVGGTQLFGARA